jgi:hypothetical protein
MIKERDLSRSLSNARARDGQKPQEVVRYNLPEQLRRELRERGGDPDEVLGNDFPNKDFPVKFARDVVAKLSPGKRLEQLKAAKTIIDQTRTQELAKVSQDLQALGIDWSDAPADVQPAAANAPPAERRGEARDRQSRTTRSNAGDPMSPQGHGDEQGQRRRCTASPR